MLLSICIVNWNTRDDLRRCLDTLGAGASDAALEIFVVDNASTDDSVAMVRTTYPHVQLICNAVNTGFAHANNQALRVARGAYLLLLNSDTLVHPGALDRLVAAMEAQPTVGIAGAKLLNPDGSLQYSCRRFPTFTAGMLRNNPLGRLFGQRRSVQDYLMTDVDHDAQLPVDWVSGAALCIRRATLEAIGPLDERFFMYCEDMDWCYCARQAGWEVRYVPESVITHVIGRSSDQAVAAMVRAHHHSMGLFFRKHYAARVPWFARWVPLMGIWVRMQLVLWDKRRRRT